MNQSINQSISVNESNNHSSVIIISASLAPVGAGTRRTDRHCRGLDAYQS